MKIEGRCPECHQESQVAEEPVAHQHGNGKILYMVKILCEDCGVVNNYSVGMTKT